MKLSSQFQEARNTIVRDGWCQHRYRIGKSVCILGALSVLRKPIETWDTLVETLEAVIDTPWDVVAWQDAPDRTKAEVLKALDEAASLAMGEEALG